MRNDFFRMTAQGEMPNGFFPFMPPPFMGSMPAGYPYRDVVFVPPLTDVAEVLRVFPNATLIPLCAAPRFGPGFGVPIPNWNGMPTGPMFTPNWDMGDLLNPKRGVYKQKPTARDWAFEDVDPAFEDYDYADDVYNFERDDRDMARALATKGPDEEDATGGNPNDEKKD